ncbi:MAG: lysostaphin resistance A-like protein [Paludibacteraceae bacterium]
MFLLLCGLAAGACLAAWSNSAAQTDIVSLKWQQLCQSLLTFALPAVVFRHTGMQHTATADLNRPHHYRTWIVALLLMPCAIPAINLTKWLNDMLALPACMASIERIMLQMEQQAETLTMAFLDVTDVQGLLLNLLVLAVVPAVAEELFFRGALQRLLSDTLNTHLAVWITAFVFSAIHCQFYGFVPRLLLGAALGYLYWYGESLWPNVVAHFVNNALTVVFAFAGAHTTLPIDIDAIGSGSTWWIGCLSLGISVLLCLWFGIGRRNIATSQHP